jgi:hypothetical protein
MDRAKRKRRCQQLVAQHIADSDALPHSYIPYTSSTVLTVDCKHRFVNHAAELTTMVCPASLMCCLFSS